MQARLAETFDAEPLAGRSASEVVELVEARGRTGRVMAALSPQGAQLLTLRPSAVGNDWGAMAISEAWVLEEQILRPELGEATLQHLGFLHDHDEAAEGRRQRLAANGLPDEALSHGRLREHCGPGPATPPQVHLLLPQAPHRIGNQPD